MVRNASASSMLALVIVGLPFVHEREAVARADDTKRATPSGWAVSRTAWGDPDLQGTWTADDSIGVPFERPPTLGTKRYLTDEDLAELERQFALERQPAPPPPMPGAPDHWSEYPSRPIRQTSFVVAPADGRIPALLAEAKGRASARDIGSYGAGPFNAPEDLTNYDRCITRGLIGSMLPRAYGNGLDILQAPGFVVIRHEIIHETRVIPLDGRPHVGAAIRQYMGDSRGRWDGATLVIETSNFTDRTSIAFSGVGPRHSDALRIVERFTRVSADTIEWEARIEDPKTYSVPFTVAMSVTSRPGYRVFEFACHEGNYALRNMLEVSRKSEASPR